MSGAPGRQTDAKRRAALPDSVSEPACAGIENGLADLRGSFIVPASDQNLIEHHAIENVEATLAEASSQPAGFIAVTVNHLRHTSAAQCSKRGPYRNAARAPRKLQSEILLGIS